MEKVLVEALSAALGAAPVSSERVHGGSIDVAEHVRLADGRSVFVKHGTGATVDRYDAEGRGLAWLGAAAAIRVPAVVAVVSSPAALVLEWIAPGAPRAGSDAALGRALAALHAHAAPTFGLDHDNWLATIPQSNAPCADWPTFYAERRLLPLLARAVDRGVASAKMRRGVESVARTIRDRCGPPEPPARLHGDLWSGNLLWDATGAPVLVDPAVYGGHREIDLAMMRLFGGFSAATFDAYAEAAPLAAGHRARVPLYQLLPLLAHVVLFGGSYVSSVEEALDALR